MFSIITPVYNGEKFIESCIQSVIEQNCSNLEHIILDGGSSDNTVNIIQQYASKYSHIRWISEKDRGQSDAMNKGIAMAKGNIIGILNVDDFYEPNVLNRVTEILIKLPEPSFVVGNCNVWDTQGKLKYVNKPNNLKLTDLLMGWKINPHPVNPSAYFYHKSLHQEVGLYDVKEQYIMDLDFIFKAVQKAKIVYVDEIWGNYRDIEGTKTFNDRKNRQGDRRKEKLINSYMQNLSMFEQSKIYFIKSIFKSTEYIFEYIQIRTQYFSNHPEQLFFSFMNKIKKIFNRIGF
ncbi:MAG: glycosyltransferase family 2 protein [Xenococcaceae cyanobacterium]